MVQTKGPCFVKCRWKCRACFVLTVPVCLVRKEHSMLASHLGKRSNIALLAFCPVHTSNGSHCIMMRMIYLKSCPYHFSRIIGQSWHWINPINPGVPQPMQGSLESLNVPTTTLDVETRRQQQVSNFKSGSYCLRDSQSCVPLTNLPLI